METRINRKWFKAYLFTFIAMPVLMATIYQIFFGCRGLCGVGFGFGSLIGIGLAIFGLALPFLSFKYRQRHRRFDRIQDFLIALVCLVSAAILYFRGWRLEPVLQFEQLLLSEAIVYLAIKDIFDR